MVAAVSIGSLFVADESGAWAPDSLGIRLLDVADQLVHGWTIIGALMVMLHEHEAARRVTWRWAG
jgi:hypothetical protein